jgi:hypothetical protein
MDVGIILAALVLVGVVVAVAVRGVADLRAGGGRYSKRGSGSWAGSAGGGFFAGGSDGGGFDGGGGFGGGGFDGGGGGDGGGGC